MSTATSYNVIYGSMAAIPILVMFIRTTWIILLVGGEFSFASQNFKFINDRQENTKLSQNFETNLLIYILKIIINKFENKENPQTTLEEIYNETKLTRKLTSHLIDILVESGLITSTQKSMPDGKDVAFYMPSFDINKMSLDNVINQIRDNGIQEIPGFDKEEIKSCSDALTQYNNPSNSIKDKLIKDL